MNKTKFVLSAVAALGVAFLLSCSKVDDEVQQSKCSANQGEWDANTKMCVKCPSGTSMSDGQCVAATPPTTIVLDSTGATTIICPAKTKFDENIGACVADIVAVDPNAAKGKFHCDYGNLDPLAVDTHNECFDIDYESECDTWGKLVPSCNAKDRRTDITYCDYGPINEWGGGCYWILDPGDCDKDWGIVSKECGTQIRWPNGTICPDGEAKTVLDECRTQSNPSGKYCYYGKADDCWLINGWAGDEIKTEADCEAKYGMVVSSCSNVTWDFCDWGQPIIKADGKVDKGCVAIRNATERQNCQQWGSIKSSCPTNYTCPNGTAKADYGWGQFVCELTGSTTPNNTGNACDYGYKHSTAIQEDNGGGCYENATECDLEYGKRVNSCNPSDRRTDLNFCDYGAWGTYIDDAGVEQISGGCWAIRTEADRTKCAADQWGNIVSKCSWLNL